MKDKNQKPDLIRLPILIGNFQHSQKAVRMKKQLETVVVVLICAGSALAQPIQVVVPNGLANVEGNSSMSDIFNSQSFRFQQVFDASQFAFIGGATGRISQISFRVDGATASEALMFFGGSTLVLSTTQHKPDALSTVFSQNVGADAVSVRTGAASFTGDAPPPGMTAAFDTTLSFTTPFFYIPSQGNLLIDITGAGGHVFFPGALDAQLSSVDAVSRVFATDGSSANGVADSLGLVTQFSITVVPEPSAMSITLLAVAVLGFLCTRKRFERRIRRISGSWIN